MNRFEEAIAAQHFPFDFENGVEQRGTGSALFEDAAAQSAHRFGKRQAAKIRRKLVQRGRVERRNDVVVAPQLGERLPGSCEQLIHARKTEREGSGLSSKFGRQLNGASADDDRPPRGAKLLGEFTEAATDFVVFAVARKVLEQENAVALHLGDVGKRRFGRLGIVNRRAMKTGQAERHAPGKEWNAEVAGDFKKQLFDAVLFGGFYGQDGMARIDEQPQLIAFSGVGVSVMGAVRIGFCRHVHVDFALPGFIDRPASVP
jgi:hypothetical protein